MSAECEGNCGKDMNDLEFHWTVSASDGGDQDFCSLVCMDSWLNSEVSR